MPSREECAKAVQELVAGLEDFAVGKSQQARRRHEREFHDADMTQKFERQGHMTVSDSLRDMALDRVRENRDTVMQCIREDDM